MERDGGSARRHKTGASKAQKEAAAAGVPVNEWLQHVKATFLGLVNCFGALVHFDVEEGATLFFFRNGKSYMMSVAANELNRRAWLCSQVRKVTARSEEAAAEADLRTAKAQVEATDEAEAKKKQLADG
jgi:multidrug resistance efflux pump